MTRGALGAVLVAVLAWMWWRNRPPISALVVALILGVIIESSSGGFLEDCADGLLNGAITVIDWLAKLFK